MKKTALIWVTLALLTTGAHAKNNKQRFDRFKPMIEAIRLDQLENFKNVYAILNPDINEPLNEFGTTILNYATSYKSPLLVDYVLGFDNIEVNCSDTFGTTALHHAAVGCDSDLFITLLNANANPKLKNLGGYTPIDLVEKLCKDHPQLVEFVQTLKD